MKHTLKKWSGFAAIVILLSGCATSVHIEKDDSVNFKEYKTFAWIDKAESEGVKDKSHRSDLTEQKIKEAVNKELAKSAGWKEVKNKPDVFLSYDVLIERASKESTSPVYTRPYSRVFYNPRTRRYVNVYYPSQFMGYDRDEQPIKEGTVTITMIEAKTDKIVWQGWTTEEVNSRNLTSKEIQYSVRSIFKKFDIAKN